MRYCRGLSGFMPLLQTVVVAASLLWRLLPGCAAADIRFDRFGVQDGLSDNTVTSVLRDSKGFMWFGTTNGLNRFDGYRYIQFKNDPGDSTSLSDNYIFSLYEDREGILWIGTLNGGLNQFNRSTAKFRHYLNDPNDPGSISSNQVYSITEGADGTKWIGTLNGLNSFDPRTGRFRRFFSNPSDSTTISSNNVGCVHAGKSGDIWIGTYSGLNVISHETGRINRLPDLNKVTSGLVQNIIDIVEDEMGALWLSTWGGGLRKFDPRSRQYTVFRNNSNNSRSIGSDVVGHMSIDRQGRLWFGTPKGLHSFNPSTNDFQTYYSDPGNSFSISNNSVWGVYHDISGILWVGTLYGGVNKMVPSKSVFRLHRLSDVYENASTGGYIDEFCESGSTLWLGSNAGLHRYNKDTDSYTTFLYPQSGTGVMPELALQTLFSDDSADLWLGTSMYGLVRFSTKTGKYEQVVSDLSKLSDMAVEVGVIQKDADGVFWCGANAGLFTYDPHGDSFEKVRIHGREVEELSGITNLVLDADRARIWVSGKYGFYVYNRKNNTVLPVYPDNGTSDLEGKLILSMLDDERGSLWLGTNDGLFSYDKRTESVERYHLENATVYDMSLDKNGNIWASTNAGLSCIQHGSGMIRNFGSDDGIPAQLITNQALYTGKDGTIYVGGQNGFYTFQPDSLTTDILPPPVVITSIKIDSREITFEEMSPGRNKVSVPYTRSPLTIEFSALDYANPKDNVYAYKIDEMNTDWIQAGNEHKVTYTNLDPGSYLFRVKAANSHGVWNEQGISLEIVIVPPFWKTLWFRALLVAAAGLVLFGAYHIRVVAIKQKNNLLQKLVDQRTEDLRQINEKLEKLAVTDDLTRINNRRSFNEYIEAQWKTAVRDKKPLSVILCDIDYFKRYNDYYGHQQGDECLYRVAQIMKHTIKRPMDFLARYGGEEFVVVLPDTGVEGAKHIAEQILTGVREAVIPHVQSDAAPHVTVSLGIGAMHPDRGRTVEDLLKMADQALYEAKSQGRNRAVIYSPPHTS